MPTIDLAGQRFGRWLVISRERSGKSAAWKCVCSCGETKAVYQTNLRRGLSTSCGSCVKREREMRATAASGSDHPDYGLWMQMKRRCQSPKDSNYRHYGGRGITVCDRWERFLDFLADMGPRPSRAHSIDRIDNAVGSGARRRVSVDGSRYGQGRRF